MVLGQPDDSALLDHAGNLVRVDLLGSEDHVGSLARVALLDNEARAGSAGHVADLGMKDMMDNLDMMGKKDKTGS